MNLYVSFIKPSCIHYQTFTYPSLNYNKVIAVLFHVLAFLVSSPHWIFPPHWIFLKHILGVLFMDGPVMN